MPADILLPAGVSMEKWSVIACDQFSSERDYWERVAGTVKGEPSTLNMMIPEVFLGECDAEREQGVRDAMEDYADRGLFEEYCDSFVYVERTLEDGSVRRGLVGAVDLEEYEFSGDEAAILASEGTTLERLPMRISIRRRARYELPHIMAFIDDKGKTVIEPLTEKAGALPVLYDFELMEGGGRVRGMRVTGSESEGVMSALRALGGKSKTLIVIGDGNHSLAAAKVYWDEIKKDISAEDREHHPARKALIEINNVYEPSIIFEAIHRVLFGVDPADFVASFRNAMPPGAGYLFQWFSGGKCGDIGVSANCIGDALVVFRDFLDDYIKSKGCSVDYIHGAETVKRLSGPERRVGLLLPAMEKSELFATVTAQGVFPKKSFSVGRARDKRYYLECRSIKP